MELSVEEKKVLACSDEVSVADLQRLAKDKNAVVRWRVAMNRNTPVRTLGELGLDENMMVRDMAKANPNYKELSLDLRLRYMEVQKKKREGKENRIVLKKDKKKRKRKQPVIELLER